MLTNCLSCLILIPRQHWCASVLHSTKDKQCKQCKHGFRISSTRFLKTIYIYFLLPNALARVNFSLLSCQLENISQVRRNNELHYSDQRKEDMSNAKHVPLTRVQKYSPARETKKKGSKDVTLHTPAVTTQPRFKDIFVCTTACCL